MPKDLEPMIGKRKRVYVMRNRKHSLTRTMRSWSCIPK